MLALFSCGGADNGEPDGPAPSPPVKSRLVAFDARQLDDGLEPPVVTTYWTDAENRNGNIYPVKASVDDELVLAVRLNKDGTFARAARDGFVADTLNSIAADMQRLANKHRIEETQASPVAMILFADRRAPYTQLLRLCKELAAQQVANLWLVTRDGRDDALRLLPLYLDNTQVFREWYWIDDKESTRTARLRWIRSRESTIADNRTLTHIGTGQTASTNSVTGWGEVLTEAVTPAGVERVQFELPDDARVEVFAECVNELSALGFKHVEPFWPPLDRPEDSPPVKERRELAVFDDDLGASQGVDIPTLSTFWRASTTENGLPAAAAIDPTLPVIAVQVNARGHYTSRVPGDDGWEVHAEDLGVLERLRRHAGEIDFDSGLSDLQVLLAIDRKADWSHFMRVREMMHQVRCFRLLVMTSDPIGPTLRLLDLSLPLTEVAAGKDVATVDVGRTGAVEDGEYNVAFFLEGKEHELKGPNFTATLTLLAESRGGSPDVLAVRLPMDEPFETYFKILSALAWLGMKDLRFGG